MLSILYSKSLGLQDALEERDALRGIDPFSDPSGQYLSLGRSARRRSFKERVWNVDLVTVGSLLKGNC